MIACVEEISMFSFLLLPLFNPPPRKEGTPSSDPKRIPSTQEPPTKRIPGGSIDPVPVREPYGRGSPWGEGGTRPA